MVLRCIIAWCSNISGACGFAAVSPWVSLCGWFGCVILINGVDLWWDLFCGCGWCAHFVVLVSLV